MSRKYFFVCIVLIAATSGTHHCTAFTLKKAASQSAKLKTIASFLRKTDLLKKSGVRLPGTTTSLFRFSTDTASTVSPIKSYIGLKILAGGAATTVTSTMLWDLIKDAEQQRKTAQQVGTAIISLDAAKVGSLLREQPSAVLDEDHWFAIDMFAQLALKNKLTEAQEERLETIIEKMMIAYGKTHKDAKNDEEALRIEQAEKKAYELGLKIQFHKSERERTERELSRREGRQVKLTPQDDLD